MQVFFDEQDYRAYLFRVSETHSFLPFRLCAYALMPNHVHLLIEAGETPLSKIMQVIQQRYTQHFNAKYQKIGHVFQGRFKSIICDRDAYLLELVRYIHLNPVRAGIVKTPEEYPWTSHRAYLANKADAWLDRDAILMQFAKDREAARGRYMDFVMGGLGQGHRKDLYEVKEDQILGSDDFAQTIPLGAAKGSKENESSAKALKKLEHLVCSAFKIRAEEMKASRNRNSATARVALCLLAREKGYTLNDVGEMLGCRRNTLNQLIHRRRVEVTSDPVFTALLTQSTLP